MCPSTRVSRHTCVQAHVCPGTRVSRHTCVQAHVCPGTHVSRHTCVQAHMCPGTHVSRHTCVQAHMCPGTHVWLIDHDTNTETTQGAGLKKLLDKKKCGREETSRECVREEWTDWEWRLEWRKVLIRLLGVIHNYHHFHKPTNRTLFLTLPLESVQM